jgi:hypothetical protein
MVIIKGSVGRDRRQLMGSLAIRVDQNGGGGTRRLRGGKLEANQTTNTAKITMTATTVAIK